MDELLLKLIQEGEKTDLAAQIKMLELKIEFTFLALLLIIVVVEGLNLWAMYKLEKKIPKKLKD